MAFLLCCRGPRSYSPPLAPPDSERLRTLRPSSAVSVALPPNTVPHRGTNDGNDEADTLRNIFRGSPSSHRGYHEAAKSTASFDTNFKFGHGNATRSTAKPPRSLRKLRHDIRQRLSQSTFSVHSSKKSIQDIKSSETVIPTKELPEIQLPPSVDNLLLSQTRSRGGYDSDAKGIETPSCRRSSLDSVLTDPEYTSKVLRAFDDTPATGSPSPTCIPSDDICKGCSDVDLGENLRTRSESRVDHGNLLRVPGGNQLSRSRSTSNPRPPTVSRSETLPLLLQIGPQESPADVVRRLSVGLANGTIHVPDTPDLKAMRMPSIVEAIPDWRLSFAAPKRASSLHRGDPEVRKALKLLGDRLEKAKRDSIPHDSVGGTQRSSLTSQLDPAVLEYIARNDHDGQQRFAANVEAGDKAKISKAGHARQERSAALSEKESVHLFNMRISQRLASTSVFPTASPSITDFTSAQQEGGGSAPAPNKLDRRPAFVGRTSVEHLRKPSDPNTRRIFEVDDEFGRRSGRRVRNSVSPMGDRDQKMPPQKGPSHATSGSPKYAGSRGFGAQSVGHRRLPSDSRSNRNSLAVAGRRGSVNPSQNEENTSLGLKNATSKLKGDTKIEHSNSATGRQSSLAEGGKHKISDESVQFHNWAIQPNEKLSMMGFLNSERHETAVNEAKTDGNSSEQSNRKVERWFLSQEDKHGRNTQNTSKAPAKAEPEDPPAKHQKAGHMADYPIPNGGSSNADLRDRDVSATHMWERALRLARDDPSFANSEHTLGSTFGELRERQSRNLRTSGLRSSQEHAEMASANPPGMRGQPLSHGNAPVARHSREAFNLDEHYSHCADAKKPLTSSASQLPLANAKDRTLAGTHKLVGAEMHGNTTAAQHSPIPAEPAEDFPSWARFPSHNRRERNGGAGAKDGVLTKDFSTPTGTPIMLATNASKLSLRTQPAEMGMRPPDSWKSRRLGHLRRKSRSMDFSSVGFSAKAKAGSKKDRRSLLNLMSLAKWKNLYRSQSTILRNPSRGHRSSLSMSSKVDFPELQPVPGYDGICSFDAGHVDRGADDDIAEGLTNGGLRDVGYLRERDDARLMAENRLCELSEKPRLGKPQNKRLGKRDISRGAIGERPIPGTALTMSSMSESAYCSDGAYTAAAGQNRGLTSSDGVYRDDWAEIYQDCVQHCNGDESVDRHIDKIVLPLNLQYHNTPGFGRHVTDSGDSYVSCSVGMSAEGPDTNSPLYTVAGKDGFDRDSACDVR